MEERSVTRTLHTATLYNGPIWKRGVLQGHCTLQHSITGPYGADECYKSHMSVNLYVISCVKLQVDRHTVDRHTVL